MNICIRPVGAFLAVGILAACSFTSDIVFAQEVASLTGVVTDPTGAVVGGASVKVVDTKTNVTYQTETSGVGSYTFTNLLPGPGYKLTISKTGFRTITVENIYLGVGSTHTQNAQLGLGQSTETVEVNGTGSQVSLDTTDTAVGNNFDMQLVHELPIQLRDNPTGLLVFEPGVVTASAADDPGGNRDGAVTGARADQQSYTLDGLDVNDYAIGQSFITVGQAPVDSIQEFRGETANQLSSEGRGSGAQVALVTKSGTNKLHGSAYEYHRNTLTEANGWFNNLNGVPRPFLLRNQFGASLGGPILKSKLFFFFNYEGRRDASQAAVEWTVPLDSYRNGLVSYVPAADSSGNACQPGSRQNTTPNCIRQLNAAGLAAINPGFAINQPLLSFILGRYPHANDLTNPQFGDGVNTGGFRTNVPAHDGPNIYVTRIDYNINEKMKLFGRFTIHNELAGDNVNYPAPSEFPGDPLTRVLQNRDYAYVVGHTWTINNEMVNQFVYGLNRQKFATPSLFNPLATTDYVSAGGTSQFGPISAPYESQSGQFRHVSVPVFRDDFTYLRGTHEFQAGGVVKPIRALSSLGNSLYSTTIGINVGSGLTGLDASARPSDILAAQSNLALWDATLPFAIGRYASVTTNYNYDRRLNALPVGTPSQRDYKAFETEAYVQDTWKARNDLTITYGLRYIFYSVPYEVNGLEATPNLNFAQYITPRVQDGLNGIISAQPIVSFNEAGKANRTGGYFHSDWHDFAPRLGFAYNPAFTDGLLGRVLGNRKTVIRGGAGMVYDHTALNSVQFLQNQVAAVFTTSQAAIFPTNPQATAAEDLLQGPFFTKVGEVPPGLAGPATVALPFSPFTPPAAPTGAGIVGNQLNFDFDSNFKTPYSETVTFGIQRELAHNFQLDATFFGRFGRRLGAESDAGELLEFKDPQSGQLMSQAFVGLSTQLRANPNICQAGGAVTPQPFFENLGGSGTTNTIANSFLCTNGLRGDMGTVMFALEAFGLMPFGVGFNPQYPYDIYYANKSASNYDGLLVTLHKKYSQGVQFDLNYTYSHSIDNLSAIANNVFGQGANFSGGVLCDPIHLRVCRGNSDFDITHIITGDGLYDLPVGKGKYFGRNVPSWMNQIIGGWQIAGDTQWRTGLAFTTLANAFPLSFNNNVPAILDGNNSALNVSVHKTQGRVQLFADPNAAIGAFSEPLGFQAGSRNNLRGPHFSLTDLSLNKHFPIRENYVLEFRAEAYNIFNHPSFGLPGGGFGGTADISNPATFGFIASTASTARVMQFALRLDF